MKTLFTFREITEKDELEEFFHFRYEIYINCEKKAFLKQNEHHIDIDHFDVHSRHYALISRNTKAGYFRIVFPKSELTNTDVLEIGKKYQLLDEEEYFHKNGKAPFPFLSYNGVPQSYWNYFDDLQSKNENIAEGSRLVLLPDFRSIRTSKFITECSVAVFALACIGKTHALISCRSDHTNFWKHFGFISLANQERFDCNGFYGEIITIPLSQSLACSSIPKNLHSKFEDMAKEFKMSGKIEREL